MNAPEKPVDPAEAQMAKFLAEAHRAGMSIVRAYRERGPVNLQNVWLRVVELALRSGDDSDVAISVADAVVAGFKDRARKLAEDSATLAYLSVSEVTLDAEAEADPAP